MSDSKRAAEIRKGASDAAILRARFPNMSKATLEANGMGEVREIAPRVFVNERAATLVEVGAWIRRQPNDVAGFTLRLNGQVRGGKNGMGIAKTGRHYAKKPFAKWRDDAVAQIKSQLPAGWQPIDEPCNIRLDYVAGDKRRRDMPAIVDAIFHVFEKAGVCADDTHLWIAESKRTLDKAAPGAVITFL